ncbi:MAG: ATP-binding protein [Gemmatimonadota bacterium]
MDPLRARQPLETFLDSPVERHTLGLMYGRRRIGKSTLLHAMVRARSGFYWEATRGEPAVHLARLGEALGTHLGVGRLALTNWEEAVARLLGLGASVATPVAVDEFGYLLEADPTLDSVLATALGPAGQAAVRGRGRLVLCGSAMAMMGALTAGEAPLRGRAGLELVMQPFDFRQIAAVLDLGSDLALLARVFAVIGGVVGYATDMVDHDLPTGADDFSRWIAARVLSPAATLHHEATTLLAEDPGLSGASAMLHHSILGAIANGAVTAGSIGNQLRRRVSNIAPALNRLVAAGFVLRHEDPIRAQRPTYALADPYLQFHYAILEPHGMLLRDRNPLEAWTGRLETTFDARVRGPVFEEQARTWVRRYASIETAGGTPDRVGPSNVSVDGKEYQIDVLVATGEEAMEPSARTVLAVGEAKGDETITTQHVRHLERARAALGARAAGAKLLLFGAKFDQDLEHVAANRHDVELVDLARLYTGE